jgi:hypothetical protein
MSASGAGSRVMCNDASDPSSVFKVSVVLGIDQEKKKPTEMEREPHPALLLLLVLYILPLALTY